LQLAQPVQCCSVQTLLKLCHIQSRTLCEEDGDNQGENMIPGARGIW